MHVHDDCLTADSPLSSCVSGERSFSGTAPVVRVCPCDEPLLLLRLTEPVLEPDDWLQPLEFFFRRLVFLRVGDAGRLANHTAVAYARMRVGVIESGIPVGKYQTNQTKLIRQDAVCACVRACVRACVNVHVYMHVCICVCMWWWCWWWCVCVCVR